MEAEQGTQATAQLLIPDPVFVFKTKRTGEGATGKEADNKGEKVFVNVCSSEKVDKPESIPSARGNSWRIPLSLGHARQDTDKKGETCTVYDIVFHPDTVSDEVTCTSHVSHHFLIFLFFLYCIHSIISGA